MFTNTSVNSYVFPLNRCGTQMSWQFGLITKLTVFWSSWAWGYKDTSSHSAFFMKSWVAVSFLKLCLAGLVAYAAYLKSNHLWKIHFRTKLLCRMCPIRLLVWKIITILSGGKLLRFSEPSGNLRSRNVRVCTKNSRRKRRKIGRHADNEPTTAGRNCGRI